MYLLGYNGSICTLSELQTHASSSGRNYHSAADSLGVPAPTLSTNNITYHSMMGMMALWVIFGINYLLGH